jgi:hypothetical protein
VPSDPSLDGALTGASSELGASSLPQAALVDGEFSTSTIAFYAKLSDTVLLCVTILPLLSLLALLLKMGWRRCCGQEQGENGERLDPERKRERDIEEERAIKARAAAT